MFTSFVRRSVTGGCASAGTTMRTKIMAYSNAKTITTATTSMIRPTMNNTVSSIVPQQRRSFSDDTTTATFDLSGAFEVSI